MHYRTIESLSEYLVVAQCEYKVEHFKKQSDGRWLLEDIRSLERIVEMESVSCTLALKDIYERVTMD